MSLYQKIANEIRSKITNGIFQKNEMLPKQSELAIKYNTSKVTIKKALDLLYIEGLVYGKRGVGTFISGPLSSYDYNAKIYNGMTSRLGELGKLTSKIVSFEIMQPQEIEREKLKLKKNELIYDIVRLRLLNDEPLALEYTIMPVHLIPGINKTILKSSVYQYITKTLNLEIGSSLRRVRAEKPDKYDEKYLACNSDDPILEVEQVVYLNNELPFEFSQSRHRYDKGDVVITNLDEF